MGVPDELADGKDSRRPDGLYPVILKMEHTVIYQKLCVILSASLATEHIPKTIRHLAKSTSFMSFILKTTWQSY